MTHGGRVFSEENERVKRGRLKGEMEREMGWIENMKEAIRCE